MKKTKTLATIGYEGTTVDRFLETLQKAAVRLVVDIRAVAGSRRPGFAKTALAANLASVGIGYVHLRRLGTPSDGRVAARAGKHAVMREIFLTHMQTQEAQDELRNLADIVTGNEKVCILCFEADHQHCHRNMVADALSGLIPIEIQHLHPGRDEEVD